MPEDIQFLWKTVRYAVGIGRIAKVRQVIFKRAIWELCRLLYCYKTGYDQNNATNILCHRGYSD